MIILSKIKIWNLELGTLMYTLHNEWVLSVVKLNFDLIASASKDKTIKVWKVTTGVLKLTFHKGI